MKQHLVPLFIPFNVRNQIINENCSKQKDINQIPIELQYSILKSYMKESKIYEGVQKRNLDILRGKSKNSIVSFEMYTKPGRPSTLVIPEPKYRNHGNTFISFGGLTPQMDDSDLKAYYKFNEVSGDIINKSEATAKIATSDLTTTNVTYGVSGIINDAVSFNGTNSVVSADGTATSDWPFMSTNNALMSYIGWVKFDNFTQVHQLIGTSDVGTGDNGMMMRVETDRTATIGAAGDGTTDLIFTTTQTIPNDANYHMVFFSLNEATPLHQYSVDDGTKDTDTDTINGTNNPDDVLHLGEAPDGSRPFAGDMDEVSIWNRVLTNSEITTLFNSGAGFEIYT